MINRASSPKSNRIVRHGSIAHFCYQAGCILVFSHWASNHALLGPCGQLGFCYSGKSPPEKSLCTTRSKSCDSRCSNVVGGGRYSERCLSFVTKYDRGYKSRSSFQNLMPFHLANYVCAGLQPCVSTVLSSCALLWQSNHATTCSLLATLQMRRSSCTTYNDGSGMQRDGPCLTG